MRRETWMRKVLTLVDDFQHIDSGSERDANMRSALARVLLAAQSGPWRAELIEVRLGGALPDVAPREAYESQAVYDREIAIHKTTCMAAPGHCGICNEAEQMRLEPWEE